MNKQYKVIWSKVRHCYVVVSELAKRSGKTKSVKAQSCQKVAVTLAVLALSLGMTGISGAANNTAGSGNGVAVGTGSSATNAAGVAIGVGATVNTTDGVALGSGSVANVGIALGYLPSYMSFDGTEVFSRAWRSSLGAVSVGVTDSNGVATQTRQIVGVAAGYADTDAVNVAQLKKLDTKIEKHRVHYFAVSTTDTDNDGNSNALGTDSMAIGPSARANLNRSLAIGKSAGAYVDGGIALGSDSYNIVTANMRGYIPTSVTLTEAEQTSPTWRSTLGALAIGVSAVDADGAVTTATQTRQIVGVAAGTQDTDAVNVAQLKALGSTVDANKISFVSINEKSRGENDNKDNDGATGEDAIAIGVFASATAPNATAMGQKAKATNYNSIALGDFSTASGIGSVALGDYATAESHSTIAVGRQANATGLQSIALGDEAKGTGYQATVVGGEAVASGINASAVGFGSNAKGQFGSALGSAATADGNFATAAGYGASAAAKSATALGEGSTANIEGGVALGSDSKTNVDKGVLGYDPSGTITSQDVLLGDNKATYDNLQTEISTAQTNVSTLATKILDLQAEYETADETRKAAIIDEIKSTNTEFEAARTALQAKVAEANKYVSVWQATGAAVSVGDSETGLTRQITNVAAGTKQTDAVNVAQLTSLSDKVDANKISYVSINTKRDANKDNDQAGVPDDKSSRDAAVIGSNNITTGLGNWNLIATGFNNTIKNISYDATTDSVTEKLVNNTYVYGHENVARNGIAIGRRNVITGDSSSDNIAIGFTNKNYGNRSVNIGNYTLTNGVDSIAVGFSAKAPKTDAIAIGSAAQANGTGSIALGQGAVASAGGGVALGYNSAADRSRGSIGYFSTLGSTDRAAIAEKLGKTAEYNQLMDTIDSYSDLRAKETQYYTYISERQKNEDLLSAEMENLYKNPEGSAAYNASLAKIREYQKLIDENNAGEVSLRSTISSTDPDYQKLTQARTALNNMFAAYMSTESAISVGNPSKGIYRQITGVAAGSEDTDAVNVAQLKDVEAAGLDFKGDGDTVVHRDLGETLNVVGGVTDADNLTEGNVGVVADDTTGTLNVKLAKNLTNLNSVKVGDAVTINASGLTITGGPSVTTTGVNAGGQKITNVAKGVDDADAVNMEQFNALNTKVDTNKISYFSVKSTKAGNQDNTGATGSNSIAVGPNSSATGSSSIAIGDDVKVTGSNAIGIGSSLGSFGDVGKAGSSFATSVGYLSSIDTKSTYGTALGAQAKIAESPDATVVGSHAEITNSENASAFGQNASILNSNNGVAIGSMTSVNGSENGIVIGTGANVRPTVEDSKNGIYIGAGEGMVLSSEGGIAVGNETKVYESKGSISIGDKATTYFSPFGVALGARAAVEVEGAVALGADSAAYIAKGKVGYNPSSEELTDEEKENIAWKSTMGAVSIGVTTDTGSTTGTRQIVGVAAGTQDTDAVNVAQLKASQVILKDGQNVTVNPVVAADGSTTYTIKAVDTYVKEGKLENNTLTFTRNDDTSFTVGDIASKTDMDSAVSNTNLKFTGDDTTAEATLTKKNGETLNILGGASEFTTANNIGVAKDGDALRVKLAKDINMGNGSVTFAPTGAKDADGNILVQGQDGKWYSDLSDATYDATNNVYTKADGTTVSAVENPTVSQVKLSNTGLDNGGNKITNVAAGTVDTDIVNLGQLKGSTIQSSDVTYADNGSGTITLTMKDGSKVTIDSLKDTYVKEGKLENNTLTFTRNDNTTFEVGDIASKSDMDKAVGDVSMKFTGDDTAEAATLTKKNGETLNILGGASEFTTANNIGVVKDGEALRVKLAKDITMGNGSITFAPTGAKDADGNTLVQGEDGKWYSDLTDATYDAGNNVYTNADGTTIDAVENPTVSQVKLSNTGLDNGGNKITNVAAGTVDTDIVNLGQLKGSTIGSSKVEYTDAGAGTITLTMQDGNEVKINGLQDKYVTGATFENNKLTITRNDDKKFEVDKIATTDDIVGENSKVNMKFTGDDTSEDGTITKINGATLNVLGGATEFTTANNIGVVKDGEALRVKLAKDVAMGNGSVTFANAKDADGNTLVQGQDGKWYSDLTDATYDAANNVYTKADGTTIDAVENPTVSEVKLSNTGLDNGGNKITNVAAGTVDTDIVNLGQLKGSTIGSSKVEYTDAGAGTITLTMQDGKEVQINGLQDKYVTGATFKDNTLTITRNDNQSFEVGDIASKSDMDSAVSSANLKFTGDDTSDEATLTKKNGETLNILGGASEFTTANNIGVVKDGDALRVKLAKDVAMGNGSVTFANAKDADGNTLVQGQDGKWYSDLTDATYDATNNVYTKADGTTVSAVENPTVSQVKLSNTGLDNGGNKITNVAAGTENTDIVNLGQLKGSTIGSSKVEYTDAGAGTITLTMQDGNEVKINGLQDKYVTGATFKDNTLTITRNDNQSFEVGDIASKTDMDSAVSNANLKFTGDDTSDEATLTKKNGETLSIYGGVAATDADGNSLLSDVNNVGVVKTDDGLQIKLAKDLSGIDSARIGGTVADGVATGGIYIANQSVKYNGANSKTETGLYITGLTNTSWNPSTDGIVSGRAATEDQLKAAYDGLSTTITANKVVAGDNITVETLPDGSGTKVSLSDNLAFGDKNGKNIAINGSDAVISAGDGESNQVVVDGANSTVTAGTGANKVTVDGTKAGITAGEGVNQVAIDGTKGQVTIGEAGKGLVMGNQEVTVKNADGTDKVDENGNAVKESGKYITGLDNTTWNPAENGYVPDRAATEGQLKDVVGQVDTKIDGINKDIETINNAKRGFNSDSGEKIERGKDDVLDIKGGAKGELSEGNIGVVNNAGSTGFDVKLAKDLKDLDSVTSNTVTTKELMVTEKANIGNVSISNDNVTIGTGDSKTVITNESVATGSITTGNTTINNGGLTIKNEDSSKNITVENNNVSMGGNVIHNVGDGVEATDAINKGQFDRTVAAIGTGMNQMNNRIGKLDRRVDRVGAGAAALAALHPLEYDPAAKWEVTAGVGNYRGANAVALGAFYRPNGDTLVSLGSSYGGGENMVNAGVTFRIGEGETTNYPSKQAMAKEIDSLKSVVSDQSSQLQAQNSKIEAQSEQLEEQNKKIEQLMQAIAELKK